MKPNGALGYTAPRFPGAMGIPPLFGTALFLYGGWVLIQSALRELKDRLPGRMTLIALAITVAFVFSAVVTVGYPGMPLGHVQAASHDALPMLQAEGGFKPDWWTRIATDASPGSAVGGISRPHWIPCGASGLRGRAERPSTSVAAAGLRNYNTR